MPREGAGIVNRRSLLASFGLAPLALVPGAFKPEPTALTERERALLLALADVARVNLPDRGGVMHAAYGDKAKAMLVKVHDALDANGTPPSGSWDQKS